MFRPTHRQAPTKNPAFNAPNRRAAFARVDVIVLAVCAGLIAGIAIAQANRIQKISRRAQCAANIRSIIQGMFIYAQSNASLFPVVPPPIAGRFENSPGDPLSESGPAAAVIRAMFQSAKVPLTRREKRETPLVFPGIKNKYALHQGSPLACMWVLILQNYNLPQSFICPADRFGTHPSTQYATTGGNVQTFASNFGLLYEGRHHPPKPGKPGQGESYSMAYPWFGLKPGGWWTDNVGADVPLISDMAPALDIHEHGKGRRAYRNPTAPLHHPKYPWAFNSGNHNGAGQNVGFGDDHVSWEVDPYVGGLERTNIFTYDSPHKRHPALGGGKVLRPGRRSKCPTGLRPSPPYVTVMVPVRNVSTGRW